MKKYTVYLALFFVLACFFEQAFSFTMQGISSGSKNIFTVVREQVMPATVKPNQDAVATYLVTNNLPFALTIRPVLPPFVTQRMGMGVCDFSIPLKTLEVCKFTVVFNAPTVGDTFNDYNIGMTLPPPSPSYPHVFFPPGNITTVIG